MSRSWMEDSAAGVPGDIPSLILSIKDLVISQSELTTTLKASLASLKERTKSLETEVAALREVIEELKSRPSPPTVPSPDHSSSHLSTEEAALSAALRVEAQRTTLESKSKRFVVMRVPEAPTEQETARNDQKLLEDIVNELHIPALTDAMNAGEIEMHRHPRQRNPNATDHARPIKVDVGSQQLRNIVLSKLRSGRMNTFSGYPRTIFCRRDLTEDELRIERANRIRCHEMNTLAGSIVYGMRDTEIIKYFTPRPFAKRRH